VFVCVCAFFCVCVQVEALRLFLGALNEGISVLTCLTLFSTPRAKVARLPVFHSALPSHHTIKFRDWVVHRVSG
jgi:hypothetical protein